MSMPSENLTNEELRQFIAEIKTGNAPRFGSPEDLSELQKIAIRPPAGMVLYKFGSRSVVGGYVLKSGMKTALKYYFPKNIFRQIGYGFRGSRGSQSWLAAIVLDRVGIPTPKPLFIQETKKISGFAISQTFLATEHAAGISLLDFVKIHAANQPRLQGVAAQLKDAFSRMERHRIAHGDMKATNILVDESQNDAISFIDLDAATFLLPPKKWQEAFGKDRKRFHKNWQHSAQSAAVFANVFPANPH